MTNEHLSLLAQIAFLVLAGAIGHMSKSRRALWLGIPLGLAMDFICQSLIAGGGPGACVGLVAFPLLCSFAIFVGQQLRRRLRRG